MKKEEIALKFPPQLTKWKRKTKKADREKDRQDRIDKWEGKK